MQRRRQYQRTDVHFLSHHAVLNEKELVVHEPLDVVVRERVVVVGPLCEFLGVVKTDAVFLRPQRDGFIPVPVDPLEGFPLRFHDEVQGVGIVFGKSLTGSHDEVDVDEPLGGRDDFAAGFLGFDDGRSRQKRGVGVPRDDGRHRGRNIHRDEGDVIGRHTFLYERRNEELMQHCAAGPCDFLTLEVFDGVVLAFCADDRKGIRGVRDAVFMTAETSIAPAAIA